MRIDQIELTGSLSISSSLATSPLRVNKTYLFVSNTGNIGIGTNNPTSKLVVTGSASIRGGIKATTASGSFTFNESVCSLDTKTAFKLPVGTTAERPISSSNGMIRFNSTTGNPEWYDSFSNIWVNFGSRGFVSLDYIVIGGGGGGGRGFSGGGGGAGGYRSFSAQTLEKGISLTVTIGAGGSLNGGTGGSTTFLTNTSSGGGGGSQNGNGGNGSSGGGAGGYPTGIVGLGGIGNIPATTPSQGNDGAGTSGNPGGGGGGAASAASGQSAGNGISSSITGTAITRSRGGAGGISGAPNVAGTPGGANTGNGGNGAGGTSGPPSGGSGGSGVVLIKWLTSKATINLTSGAETNAAFYTDGSFSIAEIKSSGLITFN
jgi:hypothetical protein